MNSYPNTVQNTKRNAAHRAFPLSDTACQAHKKYTRSYPLQADIFLPYQDPAQLFYHPDRFFQSSNKTAYRRCLHIPSVWKYPCQYPVPETRR